MVASCGVVYASQRRVLGLPLGVTYLGCEDFGDHGVIASEDDRTPLLCAAATRLLACRSVHTLKWKAERDSVQAVAEGLRGMAGVSCHVTSQEINAVLPLADSFDEFLHGLTKLARRNLAYYRRRAVAAGWVFRDDLSESEISEAVGQLIPRQRTSSLSWRVVRQRREALRGKPGACWAGLQDGAGRWLALTGGWQERGRAFMVCQLNRDGEEYRKASLSTVLRSFLIECLISRGARELTFLGGCKGILESFCTPVREHVITVEKIGLLAAVRRAAFSGVWRMWRGVAAGQLAAKWEAGK